MEQALAREGIGFLLAPIYAYEQAGRLSENVFCNLGGFLSSTTKFAADPLDPLNGNYSAFRAAGGAMAAACMTAHVAACAVPAAWWPAGTPCLTMLLDVFAKRPRIVLQEAGAAGQRDAPCGDACLLEGAAHYVVV